MRKQQDANNAPPAVQVNLQMCPSVPPEKEVDRERERLNVREDREGRSYTNERD